MKKLIYILIAFISLSACKKDEKESPLLETKWELQTAKWKYNDQSDEQYDQSYTIETANEKEYYVFNTDNTVEKFYKNENAIYITRKESFTTSGNIITSRIFGSNYSTITYIISGDTLTITVKYDIYTEISVFKKSNIDLSKAIESIDE